MMLLELTTEELVNQWESIMEKHVTPEIATVRGWLLEALELKNPEGMSKFYDDFYEDEQLRDFVL